MFNINSLKAEIDALETTYNNIVEPLNAQIPELIDGKAMIASALTDRGYPTQATDSSASMAQKIENMAYDAGWLAQLGYSETNDGGVKDAVAYSKAIKDGWNPAEITRKFTNDKKLVYFPVVDVSQYTDMQSMFYSCSALTSIPSLDTSSVTNMQSMFYSCSALTSIPSLDTSSVTNMYQLFYSCSALNSIGEINIKACNSFGELFRNTTNIRYALLKGFGTLSARTAYTDANTFNVLQYWGADSEENRMSLVHSLRDYSFDRVTAGYSACTIKLHANTLARLTAEEIAAITAKGFTLTS